MDLQKSRQETAEIVKEIIAILTRTPRKRVQKGWE